MDYASVYVQSSNLIRKINAHYKRPIVKVSCNSKFMYRKLRSKSAEGLDVDTVGIDHVSILKLNAKEGDVTQIENAQFHNPYICYFVKHPNEDVRTGWYYFAFSILLGLLSLILSIISLLK